MLSKQQVVAKGGLKKALPSKSAPGPALKKEESSDSSESDSEDEVGLSLLFFCV